MRNPRSIVQHSQALLHTRNHSSSAVKGLQQASLPEPQEEVKEIIPLKGLVHAMLTYVGMNVAPMIDDKRKRIVDAGCVKAPMGMVEAASGNDTRREALTTLAMLAPYDQAMLEAGGISLANTLSESATDNIIQQHCSALLAKLAVNKS